MKKIDALILKELAGPWAFGVGIFTVLIMAGTYLFKLTGYIVSGVEFATIIRYTLLLLPGIMVKTFSMAVLLATLLAFGRLSGDSEIVALKAGGASIVRMMVPVFLFSLVVASIAFAIDEMFVPYAAYQGTALQKAIEKKVSNGRQPTFTPVYDKGVLKALIDAKDFDLLNKRLAGATITAFTPEGVPTYIIYADGLSFTNEKVWRVSGGKMFSFDGRFVSDLGPTYPLKIAPPTPEEIIAASLRDLDSLSMAQMRVQIAAAKLNPGFSTAQIANLEYGYYNKIALPLAAIIFGLVGAPLGIRNHRTGAAVGFWLSVLIIFSYMMLANLMAIYAQGLKIPAFVASFTPLAIGIVFAVVLMQRKNQ